jgi:hypothetical protein
MCTDSEGSANLSIPQRGRFGSESAPRRRFTRPVPEWLVKRNIRLGTLLYVMAILTISLSIAELRRRSILYRRLSDDHVRRARMNEENQECYAAISNIPDLPRRETAAVA